MPFASVDEISLHQKGIDLVRHSGFDAAEDLMAAALAPAGPTPST